MPLTGGPAAAASPGLSRASSVERERDVSVGPDTRRVLRIKRFIDGKWATEIVRDAAVIRAYIRRRQIIEDETTGADTLAPTGDIDRDARAKKRYVPLSSLYPFSPALLPGCIELSPPPPPLSAK